VFEPEINTNEIPEHLQPLLENVSENLNMHQRHWKGIIEVFSRNQKDL
jgi:hypothetical protein